MPKRYIAKPRLMNLQFKIFTSSEGYEYLLRRLERSYLYSQYKQTVALDQFLQTHLGELPDRWTVYMKDRSLYVRVTCNTRSIKAITSDLTKLTTRFNRLCSPIKPKPWAKLNSITKSI